MTESEEYCCMHCGRKLVFYYANRKSRMQCPRCKWVMVIKYTSPKHKIVDIYEPP